MWEPFQAALALLLFTLAGLYQGLRQDWKVLELFILAAAVVAIRRGRIPAFEGGIGLVERWLCACRVIDGERAGSYGHSRCH